jgi:hypothetical protein
MLKKIVLDVVIGLLALVTIALIAIIGAIPMYFLWNWLIPAIFGLKMITFWEGWGILWLSGILFKSSSPSSSSSSE